MRLSHRIAGVASAALVVFGTMADAAKPILTRKVPQWAEDDRYVGAESGSSRPGKWKNDTSPLAIEPMECLGPDDPSEEVTLKFGAQLVKTEVGLNWFGWTICDDPVNCLLLLPTTEEIRVFNANKWDPTVKATPALSRRLLPDISRSKQGSTTSIKRFRGGHLFLTTALSSKGLQGKSIRRLWGDEVSEFPAQAGDRGDPLKQAKVRGDAQEGELKCLWTSTPKDLPTCRITILYDRGDQRQYYAECPHCSEMQVLLLDNLVPSQQVGGRACFMCVGCGVLIDEIHKSFMLGDGRYWIKTYPSDDPANPAPPLHFPKSKLAHWRARISEGRNPSFHAWQAYSKLKSWTKIWANYVEARRDVETGSDTEALKTFTQQVLGMAYDAATDTPDSQKLFDVRGKYVRRGVIPGWACEILLTGDVQGDRVEWDVFAMGPDLAMARFDWGVIEKDPRENEAWADMAGVIGRRWPGEKSVDLGADIVGIDSGGMKGITGKVYQFVRAKHNVFALKGSSDYEAVPITKGKRKRYRLDDGTYVTSEPWLVGGWGLKSAVYAMLDISLLATDARLPGGLYNPIDATLEDFKQLTAEVFKKPKSKRAGAHGWWERIPGQANERLDLASYARALAWKRGAYTRTAAEWQALMLSRLRTPEPDLPLLDLLPKPMAEPKTPENPGAKSRNLFQGLM